MAVVLSLLAPITAYGIKGDVNKDNLIDIKDVVISLQTIVGLSVSGNIDIAADVNGDGNIGLEEAVYVMKIIKSNTLNATGNENFSDTKQRSSDTLSPFREYTARSNSLPSKIDYSSFIPEIKSQGPTGSCTSWATGYYLKSYQEAKEEGWDVNENAFSPMFLYAMQCKDYESPWDLGNAHRILAKYGCAKLNDVKFEVLGNGIDPYNPQPERIEYATYAESFSTEIKEQAMNYKSGDDVENTGLGQTLLALTKGPVLLSIYQFSNRMRSNQWHPSNETNYLEYDPANNHIKHAVLCVGYDDAKFGEGALKFVNSWGKEWAIDGFSWIKYSDYQNIVDYSMSIDDIANPISIEEGENIDQLLPPTNVNASYDIGPYVDISWDRVGGATQYQVFRRDTENANTFKSITLTTTTTYRDFPEVGREFLYIVQAINDLGASDAKSYQVDYSKFDHVDIGRAAADSLPVPELLWQYNDSTISYFELSNADDYTAESSMEVFVSKSSSSGPWTSFGWILPDDFYIDWDKVDQTLLPQPFVRVVVSSVDGVSQASLARQLGEPIALAGEVATIDEFSFLGTPNSEGAIELKWKTDGGPVEYFVIWRIKAEADDDQVEERFDEEWQMIGYSLGKESYQYIDETALPGVSYYYAIFAYNEEYWSDPVFTLNPVQLPLQMANLQLSNMVYYYDIISNPLEFEIDVWNTGSTTINDYWIELKFVDWTEDGTVYGPYEPFLASEIAGDGQLPLKPGYQHKLYFSKIIPGRYADMHFYSWIISIDSIEGVEEQYYADNLMVSEQYWILMHQATELELMDAITSFPRGNNVNPANLGVAVANNGPNSGYPEDHFWVSDVYDYSICFYLWDWDEMEYYLPFKVFASDIASDAQLPLSPGYYHELSPFSMNLPYYYADGHTYTWDIEINCDDVDPDYNVVVRENDYSDNVIETWNEWSSWDLSEQVGELRVESVNYYYGKIEVESPFKMEVEVRNSGETYIYDYDISIFAYDATDGKFYDPLSNGGIFNASDQINPAKLPMPPGSSHVLLFSYEIPIQYADGHEYYWIISVDESETVTETNEEDNWLVGELPWYSYESRRSNRSNDTKLIKEGAIGDRQRIELIRNIDVLKKNRNSRNIDPKPMIPYRFPSRIKTHDTKVATSRRPIILTERRTKSQNTNILTNSATSRAIDIHSRSNKVRRSPRTEMKIIDSRPFSTIRNREGLSIKRRSNENAEPIRFKRPPFNIDHRK